MYDPRTPADFEVGALKRSSLTIILTPFGRFETLASFVGPRRLLMRPSGSEYIYTRTLISVYAKNGIENKFICSNYNAHRRC